MPTKQTEWSRAYVAKAYERISVTVPKGRKADIEKFLAANTEYGSINGLINELLREKLDLTQEEWKSGREAVPGD